MTDQQTPLTNSWNVQVTIVKKVLFKIDTGAEVTAGVSNQWNMEWDVEWNGGMEWWNGMVEWNGGME